MLQAKGITPEDRFTQIRSLVLECEKLGYHSVWLDDHLMYNDWPILECWTTLSALASITSNIRLGTMVSCIAHRNPALLAKTAATLDVLSSGRLELGLGAGVQVKEHLAYGFGFPDYKVRIERLAEAIQIIKLLWSSNDATFQGKYFCLDNAACEPKPLQKPQPPLTVGGNGKALISKVAALYADRFDWGFLPSIEEYKCRLDVLEKECKKQGREFSAIEKSCWPSGQVLIAESEKELAQKISEYKPANVRMEDFAETTLMGTADQCIERLQVFGDLGVTTFMLYFADFPYTTGLRFFAKTVVKKVNG